MWGSLASSRTVPASRWRRTRHLARGRHAPDDSERRSGCLPGDRGCHRASALPQGPSSRPDPGPAYLRTAALPPDRVRRPKRLAIRQDNPRARRPGRGPAKPDLETHAVPPPGTSACRPLAGRCARPRCMKAQGARKRSTAERSVPRATEVINIGARRPVFFRTAMVSASDFPAISRLKRTKHRRSGRVCGWDRRAPRLDARGSAAPRP